MHAILHKVNCILEKLHGAGAHILGGLVHARVGQIVLKCNVFKSTIFVVVDFVTDETSPTRLPVDCVHHGPVSRTIWTGEDLP